jgi:hypothetical protein
VLLETVAASSNPDLRAAQIGNTEVNSDSRLHEQQRSLADVSFTGNHVGPDQSTAEGSGTCPQERISDVCQRTVGKHSLPDYGPVCFVNRRMRTRMRVSGVVWGAGEKNPRLPDYGSY